MESEPAATAELPAMEPAEAAAPEREAADGLSPAVRRLVRQYDLDITAIHGTGPEGRIRVGDVIALLGGKADAAGRFVESPRADEARSDDARAAEEAAQLPRERAAVRPSPRANAAPAAQSIPVTTVFECDLGRVLAHRKRQTDVEPLLTSYFLVACRDALKAVPEIVASAQAEHAPLGVLSESPEGDEWAVLIEQAALPSGTAEDRLRAFDALLRAAPGDIGQSQLTLFHYGPSGSLLATPTPLAESQAASLGVGRVRREVRLRAGADGEETPRVAAVVYVSLSFDPERLPPGRAHRFMRRFARTLESWPD